MAVVKHTSKRKIKRIYELMLALMSNCIRKDGMNTTIEIV